jgi:acyl carrier protein phosphodiesterase
LNYLFHLFLSDPAEEALLGSLLGDFVKGSPAGRFSAAVADAILFHRKIDSFSDAHPIPRRSRQRVSPERRRFAGIIVDICYDHFLIRHWRRLSPVDPNSFIERVYAVLDKNRAWLPERLRRILPRMIAEDWLGSYAHMEGVGDTLDRIAARLSKGDPLIGSVAEIEANYQPLESDFLGFFPELTSFCMDWRHRGSQLPADVRPDGGLRSSVKPARVVLEPLRPRCVVGPHHDERPEKRLRSVQEMPYHFVSDV